MVDAIRSTWLSASGRVLDLDCGTEEHVDSFDPPGCQCLGIDNAPTAIAKARVQHEGVDGDLRFEMLDLCEQTPPGGVFDIIIRSRLPPWDSDLADGPHREKRRGSEPRAHMADGVPPDWSQTGVVETNSRRGAP